MRRPSGRQAARLPLSVLLAVRLLKSARRDSFTTFLSAVAGVGMALGVGALVLSLAALSGFQGELKKEILARTPEIAIAVDTKEQAIEVSETAWRLRGVVEVDVTMTGLGWIVAGGGVQPVELTGFEQDLPPSFSRPSASDPGLYIPESLARSWLLEIGDVVEVASSRPTLTPLGPQPRVRRLGVRGTFPASKVEHTLRAALPLEMAESLLAGGYRVLIATGDLDRALQVAAELRQILPAGADVATWRDLNRALFFALRLEKAAMFLAVTLIVLVAALALVSDLSLIIANKRREIGMLRAMGMSARTLIAGYCLFGSMLAVGGIVSGAGLGLGLAAMLDRKRLLRLPEDVYFLEYVPFSIEGADVVAVIACAAVVALGSIVYAARAALALDPVEALRR